MDCSPNLAEIDEMYDLACKAMEKSKVRGNCFIYKYVSFNDSEKDSKKIKTIFDKKTYVNCVNDQNDDIDTIFGKCTNEEYKKDFDRFMEGLRFFLKSASFTISEDSIKMWERYANNYNGICVQYITLDKNELNIMRYRGEQELVDLQKIWKCMIHSELFNDEYNEKIKYIFYLFRNYKYGEKWMVENEIRYLTCLMPDEDPNVSNYNIGISLNKIFIGQNVSKKNREILYKMSSQYPNLIMEDYVSQ